MASSLARYGGIAVVLDPTDASTNGAVALDDRPDVVDQPRR
jgi:hypothetical protein